MRGIVPVELYNSFKDQYRGFRFSIDWVKLWVNYPFNLE